jgi:hypothetical protein
MHNQSIYAEFVQIPHNFCRDRLILIHRFYDLGFFFHDNTETLYSFHILDKFAVAYRIFWLKNSYNYL